MIYWGKIRKPYPSDLSDAACEYFQTWCQQWLDVQGQLVEPPPDKAGFQVLPKRWVVERTFAWLGKFRRLSKDYETLTATSETWIYAAMVHLMAVVWLFPMLKTLS